MKPIYFLHIPKTAGASATLFLDQLFSPDQIFPYQRWDHLFNKNSIKTARKLITDPKYKFFRGHFGYQPELVSKKFVFTILRDPTTRTISQFKHIVRSPTDNWTWPGFLKKPDEKLIDVLADKGRASYITNLQVRYLSADFHPLKTIKNSIKPGFLYDCQKQFVNSTVNHPTKSLILAFYRLISMDFFGLQEFYDESMYMLSTKLKINLPLPTTKVHLYEKETSQSDVDTQTYNLLQCTNNLDTKLYSLARKIFIKRLLGFIKQKTGKSLNIYDYLSNRAEYLPRLTNNPNH